MNENSQPIFFPVSRFKLIVMSLVTFGFYEIFWFYKNWQLLKTATGRDISPFWRTVFSGIFGYFLFKKIKLCAKSYCVSPKFSPFLLTIVWIGLNMCFRVPNPYGLVSNLSVIALLPVQERVNKLNCVAARNHNPNSRFSAGNILTIAVGGSLTVLAIVGILMPA
ncbi:hypothetical protein [Microcoleus sp. D3_18_C4]|uniref:hypothetical protein n=1 Tax=Microcoleus sp. D3_18_C4 TaxID=3055335 RepID=UPI002FCFD9A7